MQGKNSEAVKNDVIPGKDITNARRVLAYISIIPHLL